MRSGASGKKNLLWFFIFVGAISGSLLGDVIGNNVEKLHFLNTSCSIGTNAPFILNLKVMIITLGVNFKVNIMTIIGVMLAIILYRKY